MLNLARDGVFETGCEIVRTHMPAGVSTRAREQAFAEFGLACARRRNGGRLKACVRTDGGTPGGREADR